jgi:hypothetical protein
MAFGSLVDRLGEIDRHYGTSRSSLGIGVTFESAIEINCSDYQILVAL